MKDERVTGVEDDNRFEMHNVHRDRRHQKNTGLKKGGKQSMGLGHCFDSYILLEILSRQQTRQISTEERPEPEAAYSESYACDSILFIFP